MFNLMCKTCEMGLVGSIVLILLAICGTVGISIILILNIVIKKKKLKELEKEKK